MFRKFLSAAALVIALSAAAAPSAHAQQLIWFDPVSGPICAGPLGPGPCAAVAAYLLRKEPQDEAPGPGRICSGAQGPAPCVGARPERQADSQAFLLDRNPCASVTWVGCSAHRLPSGGWRVCGCFGCSTSGSELDRAVMSEILRMFGG